MKVQRPVQVRIMILDKTFLISSFVSMARPQVIHLIYHVF